MTLDQLIKELGEIKTPLLVKRSDAAMQRVFNLYRLVAGRPPRGSGCYMCAVDAYYELKRISQIGEGWDNSVNLLDTLIIKEPKLILKMEKYKMTRKSFRVFGSPDTITEENTSDKEVETLLAENPSLSKFFVIRETDEKVEAPKAKRNRRTKAEIQSEKEASLAVVEETNPAEFATEEVIEQVEETEKSEEAKPEVQDTEETTQS